MQATKAMAEMEQGVLKRILILLVFFAGLADRRLPLFLPILRRAEVIARPFIATLAQHALPFSAPRPIAGDATRHLARRLRLLALLLRQLLRAVASRAATGAQSVALSGTACRAVRLATLSGLARPPGLDTS